MLQGILVYMFRELVSYCVSMVTSSGYYSLAIQHTSTVSFVMLRFWAGNVYHRVCLGGAPRGLLLPRKVIALVSSFLSLFETYPTCVALIDFEGKLSECLIASLPGSHCPTIVHTIGPKEFERSLATPTVQIIERHDYRTILDFLMMKLRTALDRDWLQQLPLLHKVKSQSQVTLFLDRKLFSCQFQFFNVVVCHPIGLFTCRSIRFD